MMKTLWFKKIACAAPLFVAICSVSNLAAAASEPGTKVIKSDLHVVVKSGDTLTSIVSREMGSLDLWPEVVEHNKLKTPNSLVPGEIIVIPWRLLALRNFAKIVFFKGDVTLVRKGSDTPLELEKGDKIYIGDSIKTGENGFVSLTFKGDSLVNIQPESHMLLKELECFDTQLACQIEINTTSGQMKMNVKNVGFSKPTQFTIDTPYASAAVRGTILDFATGDGNIMGVTEGAVEITANNRTSNVPRGKGTLAGEGRSVSVWYDLLPQPEFNEFLRISAEDSIAWTPIEDAASYKVVISGSESMTDIIQSSTEQNIAVSALTDPGRYFISARAVARNGIKGFTSKQVIDQAKIDEKVSAPELDIELIGDTLTIEAGGRYTSEVHIGDSLVAIDGLETLINYKPYDVAPGKTLTLTVDPSKDIFLTSRAVINESTVSTYGSLYELKKAGK